MKPVFLIGGYARTGKTTALAYLASQGVQTLSTSAVLQQITTRLIQQLFAPHQTLEDISNVIDTHKDVACFLGKTGRELKTCVAENIAVPVLGRECLVNAVAGRATIGCVIETIGGHEADLLIEALEYRGFDVERYNIVQHCAPQISDIRIPLKFADTITNDGTKEEFLYKIHQMFAPDEKPYIFGETTRKHMTQLIT